MFVILANVLALQGSLLGFGELTVDQSARFERMHLDDHSWIDVARGWHRGSDDLFAHLADTVEWKQGRRVMWDRLVDDPRLSRWIPRDAPDPHPALVDARATVESRYDVTFGSLGLNFYRDGRDSVAFHRDRELRALDNTLIAILTLGAARPFLVRPLGGGASIDVRPASGDLLVMGGATQRRFEPGVPKVAHSGPRISCSWRWTAGAA